MSSNSFNRYKTIRFNKKSNKITTKSLDLRFEPTHILGLTNTYKNIEFLIVANSSNLSEFNIPVEFNLNQIYGSQDHLLDSRERLCIPKKFKDLILKPGDDLVSLFVYENHIRLYNEKNSRYFL